MMPKAVTVENFSPLESPTNRFYRTVWRWHFYAGIFVIPFMLLLAITGSIYLFKPQLDAVMYHNQIFVRPSEITLPYTQQVEAAQHVHSGATVTKIIPNAASHSTEIGLTTADQHNLTVFVNPHTGQVLGSRDEDHNLQATVRKLHGELMIGKIGDYIVELAACWGLVLLITGLYLWLPRNGFSIFGTLVPRIWSKNRRVFWRDLHAVSGFYGILLVGFLILTGLPWSVFWGETFAQVWSRFPAQMWDDIPQSTVLTGALNQRGSQVVPWAVEQLPMPHSKESEHQHHSGQNASLIPNATSEIETRVNLDSVIELAKIKGVPPGFSVSLPADKTGVYTVSASPNNPTGEVTMHIDQYTGQILADIRWQDYGLVPKAVEMGAAIHMGKYFGLGNQLLMLFACLIVILLCVSSAVMWWQRRPSGKLGAPTLPPYVQQWRPPVAIVAVLGLIFPLVGFSLITVLLLDYLVITRIPALKRILN